MSQRIKKRKNKKSARRPAARTGRFRLSGFAEFHLEDRTVPTTFDILNGSPILIPGDTGTGAGISNPYPSTISVSVPSGEQLTSLQVVFNNLSHERPEDIDAMLIAPDGTRIYLMSDVGGDASQPINGVALTFSDAGTPFTTDQIFTGTYAPTNINQGDDDAIPGAPTTGSLVTTLAGFKGINPNGDWELRINDDEAINAGMLQGGWRLIGESRVNAAPTANNDSYTTNEDTTLTVTVAGTPPGVLFNDTDPDNDPLTAILETSTHHGTLAFNPDGSFSYIPRANFHGADSFSYRANDGVVSSNIATVTITVLPVNDVPVANNDVLTIQNGGPQTIHRAVLVHNDIDPDLVYRTTIFFEDFEGPNLHPLQPWNVGTTTSGDGTDWTESLPAGWVRDNTNTPPPSSPTAAGAEFFGWHVFDIDSWTAQQGDQDRSMFTKGGAGMRGTIIAADGDAYDDFFTFGANRMNTLLTTPAISLAGINANTLRLEFDSSFKPENLDPDGDQEGKVEVSLDNGANWINLQDLNWHNSGGANGSLLRINEHFSLEVNNPAAATSAIFRFSYLNAENDWWWAVDNIRITGERTDPAQHTIQIQSQPSQGSVAVDANGAVVYTPPTPGFTGTTSFTYRLFDGVATSNTATVNLTVNANNSNPVAVNDHFETAQGVVVATQYDRSLLANDTDIDLSGGNVGVRAVLVNGPTAAQGTLALNPDGTILFTPNPTFAGDATFTYRVNDGSRDSNTATVTITVTQTNEFPPVAIDDSYSVNNNAILTVTAPGVLANDTDADNNPLTAVATLGPNGVVLGPSHGTLTFNADGSFTYVPRPFFNGTDSFTYRAFDAINFSNLATVTITVNAGNVAPASIADTFYTQTNTPLTVAGPGVLRNDQDDGVNVSLFFEDFEGLTLGPWNAGTTGTGDGTDWTEDLPASWIRDNTNTPPPSSPTAAGAEFFGWHAMDADSWGAQQGDQNRSDFTRGGAGFHGTVFVADGDAYADFVTLGTNRINTFLETPAIPLGSIGANSLTLEFDSSFRPEAPAPNNSVGRVEVSYDNGTTWLPLTDLNNENSGGNSSRLRTNEHLTLDAFNPAGAATAKFRFGYKDAENDWWWAIDNVRASGRTPNAGATMTAQIVAAPPASQGTVSLNPNGGFTFTPAAGFTGVAKFTYRTNDGTFNSAPATVSILVGPQAAVQVNDDNPQRSRVTSLQVTFAGTEFATTQPRLAFTLMQGTTAIPFQVTNVDYSTGATIVTLGRFTGALTDFGSLADGNYTLTVLSAQVTINGQPMDGDGDGVPGGNHVYNFHRLFGDVNGDKTVNGLDLGFFRDAFGSTVGDANYRSYLDFNQDGAINGFDLGFFRDRFGIVLPKPPPSSPTRGG